MKTKFKNTLLITLCFLFTFTAFVNANGTILNTKPDGAIRVYDNSMVWMGYEKGQWDIYHLDIATNTQTNITKDENVQGYPDVWGKYIVWQEKSPGEDFHIYLYDMNTGVKEKVSEGTGRNQEPRISQDKVVWTNENSSGKKVVMLYDIKSRRTKQISSQDAMSFGLEFDGNIAAWMDYRNGRFDIYMYDTAADKEKRVTFGLEDEVDPLVSDGKVVWTVRHNNVKQIYMYDVNKDEKTRLTVGKEDHTTLAFSEGSLILVRGNELIINSINEIIDLPIETPNRDLPKQVFILGSNVLWFDGEAFFIEEIDNALKRANGVEETPSIPVDNEKDTEKNKDKTKEDKKDYILVKAKEDTTITTDDGILTLNIEKGTFDEDVHMVIQKENLSQITDYQLLSPVYSWQVVENIKPNKPIELIMDYGATKYEDNPEKVLIYTKENNQLVPLPGARNVENNTLKTEVMNNGNVVLSAYSKTFIDMQNHWAYKVVDVIAAQHMINGYPDGTFKPDQQMTRAEFVSILVKGGKFNNKEANSSKAYKNHFNDVDESFWAADAINIAYERGWVSGYNGKFNPNDPITREQMITILMNLYKENEEIKLDIKENSQALEQYVDKQDVSSWAKDTMEKAVNMELIQGYNGKLTPLNNATRAEAATMIYRYLQIIGQL